MDEKAPIAIFDSGVGSYSVVKALRVGLPHERLVYLADRASFPYGEKSKEELFAAVDRAVEWLEEAFHPKLIVVGSNTPSIQVLPELVAEYETPLIGVFPPLREAASITKTGHIAILGTHGAVSSPEMKTYIHDTVPAGVFVRKVNAGSMVGLVEPGTFITDPKATRMTIRSVLDPVFADDPDIDVMTLSSTHLPFLLSYLTELYPQVAFLDPAEAIATQVEQLAPRSLEGEGGVEVYATESEDGSLSLASFKTILKNLGLDVPVQKAVIPSGSAS